MEKFIKFIATGCYSGYFPIASGTIGTLVGLLLFLLFYKLPLPLYLIVIIGLFFIGAWTSTWAEILFKQKDSSYIVIDEIVGFLITMMLVPAKIGYILAGFFLFRLFDIFKPYPGRKMEKIKGGFGIMLDDVFAGVYANIILQLIKHLLLR